MKKITAQILYDTLRATGDENKPLAILSDPEGNSVYWLSDVGANETFDGTVGVPLAPGKMIRDF